MNTPTIKTLDFFSGDMAFGALRKADAYHHAWKRAVRWKCPRGFRLEMREHMRSHALDAVKYARAHVARRAALDAKYPLSAA